MGTSTSYPGPTGPPPPLLPPWAEDPIAPPPNGQPPPVPPDSPDQPPQQGAPLNVPAQPPGPTPTWRAPKAAASRYARGNGTLGTVARSYVRATGGARRATSTARAGRESTGRIGGLAAALARGGVAEVATRLGIADLVGMDAQSALAAFIDRLAPVGGLREDGIARRAVINTISALFDRFAVARNGITALNGMTADGVRTIVVLSITNYVDARFQQELISRIERSAISEQAANQLATQIKDYIETNVRLDLSEVDVVNMDWEGAEGKRFVDAQYLKAYELLGGAS